MKTSRILVSAMLGLAAAGMACAADPDAKPVGVRADVTFVQPEKFADVRDAYAPSEMGRNGILDQLRDYIVSRANYYVPEGQKLTITFTDIDLAGDFEPWRGGQGMDIRVVKDIYPPKMDFDFKLTDADGKVLKEGKRQLRDLVFMSKLTLNTNDALHFDKTLLEDWLHNEFPRGN
jgi:hypothetical protein